MKFLIVTFILITSFELKAQNEWIVECKKSDLMGLNYESILINIDQLQVTYLKKEARLFFGSVDEKKTYRLISMDRPYKLSPDKVVLEAENMHDRSSLKISTDNFKKISYKFEDERIPRVLECKKL